MRRNDMSKKTPRSYQKEAISAVLEGFETESRGQLILPCGAGKTLVALWIKERMGSLSTLVVVPSLSLLRQIKDEWVKEGENIPRLCVCSEKDMDHKDSLSYSLSEIDGTATIDPKLISRFCKENKRFIIYSTYQSLDKIRMATKGTDIKFDLAICDEAHRCAGGRSTLSKFLYIHNNNDIPADKRLYMTATQRVFSEGNQESNTAYCMTNEKIFGKVFYYMSFGEAIDKKILVDYRIIAVTLDCKEIKNISNNENGEYSKLRFYNNHALEVFMKEHNASHVVSFHSSIKKASDFKIDHEIISETPIHHVNGTQTSTERKQILSQFENEKKSIITNSRCLTEGIDVPAIDAVYFCDPKNSKLDILQAVGRALRRADDKRKEIGYIVVPLFHSPGNSLEEEIKSSSFSNLISVIRAINFDDSKIDGVCFNGSNDFEKGLSFPRNLIFHGGANILNEEIKKKISFDIIEKMSFPGSIEKYSLKEAGKLIKKYKLKSSKQYKDSLKTGMIIRKFPYCPDEAYKNQGWISWANFLGTGRIHANKRANMLVPYETAIDIVRNLNIKSAAQYRKYADDKKFPCEMPITPSNFYKDQGWVDWPTFLGTIRKPECFTYDELKKIVQNANILSGVEYEKFRENHPEKNRMPFNPIRFYTKKGTWVSSKDLLGISKFKKGRKDYLGNEEK